MQTQANKALPRAARLILIKLGEDIAVARKKRRVSTVSMAERAFISRGTLYKVERGDPTVSIGIYATVLAILGLDIEEDRADSIGRRNDWFVSHNRTSAKASAGVFHPRVFLGLLFRV